MLAGIAIATDISLRHRPTTDSHDRRALADVCTVPMLLVYCFNCHFNFSTIFVSLTIRDPLELRTWCFRNRIVIAVTLLCVAGPVVSALANRFGCRIVSIVGSLIAGVFFAVSQFSPNIDVMIFTYGVMGGRMLTPCVFLLQSLIVVVNTEHHFR